MKCEINVTENKIKNLFILTTPFQLFVAEHMIMFMNEFKNSDNILLFEEHFNLPFSRDSWSSVYTLTTIGYSPIGTQKTKAAEENLKLVLNLLDLNAYLNNVIFSNIHYSLLNYFFFNKQLRSHCRFLMIIDGIGSYTNPKITLIKYLRDLIKFIAGQLGFGIKYRPYLGNYLGDHFDIINCVYGFQSQYMTCEESKRIEVPLLKQLNSALASHNCLFLDQNNYQNLHGYNTWRNMLVIAINYILKEKFRFLYYKSHPDGNLSSKDLQYIREKGFEIIENKRCIEQLFQNLNISVVVSFSSTSLFMLKCIYGDTVRCVSLLDQVKHFFPLSYYELNSIRKLFQITNVELC